MVHTRALTAPSTHSSARTQSLERVKCFGARPLNAQHWAEIAPLSMNASSWNAPVTPVSLSTVDRHSSGNLKFLSTLTG